MANENPESITVELLADHERLIPVLGEICWREWGHAPEPVNLDWWIETTRREAGRDRLPITWVAIDGEGNALGRVGLGEFDLEERRELLAVGAGDDRASRLSRPRYRWLPDGRIGASGASAGLQAKLGSRPAAGRSISTASAAGR